LTNGTASHINNDYEFYSSVREPAVSCESFVDGVQQAKILVDGLVVLANLEDI
jgi:hypothetical protein